MTSISIHGIKKIKIDDVYQLEDTNTFCVNILIRTKQDSFEISLFSDDKNALKIIKTKRCRGG